MSSQHRTVPADAIVIDAALFLAYNSKKDPSAISRFKARVIMGEPVALDIDRLILKHGWRLGFASDDGVLAAIEAVEKVYRTAAGTRPAGAYPEILDQTLAAIVKAWGHERTGANGHLIAGIAQVLSRFGEVVDPARLATKLSNETPRNILAKARVWQGVRKGTVPSAVALIAVGLYNDKLHSNQLPEWVWTR